MKKVLGVLMEVIAVIGFMAVTAFSADKLVVMDSTASNTVFGSGLGSGLQHWN